MCVLMVECMSVVVNIMLSLTSVMSTFPHLCELLVCKVMYFGSFCFRGVFVS